MKTLRECMPDDLRYDKSFQFADVEVIKECGGCIASNEDRIDLQWVGIQKNVYYWVILANGYAVGWNENPSRGWSFPFKKLSKKFLARHSLD